MRQLSEIEAEWMKAIEGMTFFGIPLDDLPKERLLLLIGHFVAEKRRLEADLRLREAQAFSDASFSDAT